MAFICLLKDDAIHTTRDHCTTYRHTIRMLTDKSYIVNAFRQFVRLLFSLKQQTNSSQKSVYSPSLFESLFESVCVQYVGYPQQHAETTFQRHFVAQQPNPRAHTVLIALHCIVRIVKAIKRQDLSFSIQMQCRRKHYTSPVLK